MVVPRPAQTPPSPAATSIPFIDLKAQQRRLRPDLERAMARVLDHGQYIMGPEVDELERALADLASVDHVITCASGTDALLIALMAKEIGPGDAVICPAFTFAATPEAIALLGATPIFCDVREDTFNLDVVCLSAAVEAARKHGLKPKAIVAVDLFGQPVDYDALELFARDHALWILADAAQSFGAMYRGRSVGTLGLATATSFFPAKPLGCYGDGGAILTNDHHLAAAFRSLRAHGKGRAAEVVRIGINGRLDTLQAAILLQKLKIFTEEIALRKAVARRYDDLLGGEVTLPILAKDVESVWAQYTIRVPAACREELRRSLAFEGIPTAVYYAAALPHQPAYRRFPVAFGGVPVSERLAYEVLSLPMHPYLGADDQARIAAVIKARHPSN